MNKVNRIVLLLLLFCLPSLANGKSWFGRDVSRLFILGGELSNSAATSVADIDEVMPRMAALGLNTVLVPAYWDLIEPVEGQYDFTLIDPSASGFPVVWCLEEFHVLLCPAVV